MLGYRSREGTGMMKPKLAVLALFAVTGLAGCGGDKAAEQEGASANAVAAAGDAVECTGLPDHVALMPDAKVSLCTRAEAIPGRISGTVIFTTASNPDAVIAFYKEKTAAAGLQPGITAPGAYSAREGTKRTMMVLPEAAGSGSKVSLNWGQDK
jgi:hypothetical protein